MTYNENFETESRKVEYGVTEQPSDISPEDLAPSKVMELEFNVNSHTSVRNGLPF